VVGVLPTTESIHWDGPWSDDCHHQVVILVESIVEWMEGKREFGFWIFIRHPCPLIFGETIIQSVEESTDLVFITTSAG